MATGYEESRFETKVAENLQCAICREVLKDPVQCCRNKHHFCGKCIAEHLKYSPKCLRCQDHLTVETLAKPQRFLASTLECLLAIDVASSEFSPVPCSNDQCEENISQRDKEIHENKVCHFRHVKCDYCGQMVLYKNFMQHRCPPRPEIREIKAELTEICKHTSQMKAELREVRSTQDEILRTMQAMLSKHTSGEGNMPQRSKGSHASSSQEVQVDIVVARGDDSKSVEAFNKATKTWRPPPEMNEVQQVQ